MAKKGISIPIASDTRDFSQGIKNGVIQPLEGVEDALDAVAREGDQAGEKLEKALTEAQQETEQLTDKHQELGRVIRDTAQASSRAMRGANDSTREATRGASEGLRDLKDESRSTAREAAASFDGSAQSIIDAFQEVSANAFIGFGPAGLVAGLAAAAGIGLISSAIQKGDENAEQLKARVSELTSELIEAGTEGGPSLDYIVDRLKELATSAGEGETSLKQLREAADGSGSSYRDLARAFAGNTDQLDRLVKKGKEREAGLTREIDLARRAANGAIFSDAETKIRDKIKAQQEYNTYLDQAKTAAEEAAAAERNWLDAGGAQLEQRAAILSTVDTAYDDAAGAVDDYIDAESGVFDVTRYIAAMQARKAALQDYQKNLAESQLTDEAKGFLNEQGAEAAAQFLAGYKAATPAQQAELNALWTEAGNKSSAAYIEALSYKITGQTILGPTVTLDTAQASQQLLDLVKNPVNITVKIKNTDEFFSRYGVKVP